MAISADGIIVWVEENVTPDSISEIALKNGWDISDSSKIQVVETHEGEWIMPGFIDTHTVRPKSCAGCFLALMVLCSMLLSTRI